jgi:3-oxoacyl-[acyl-carrier protein] reductase
VLYELDFSRKSILVVGGSTGIGNGIAQAFRVRGADVTVTGTRACPSDYAEEPDADFDGLGYERLDLHEPRALERWPIPVAELDVLILCQGAVRYGRAEFEIDTFRDVVEINLNSVMALALKFHGLLMQSQGSLITISSIAAFNARLGNPAYASSKAGTVALTRTLAEAWARDGIRVNGIAPGLVPSRLTRVTTDDSARLARALKQIPLRRMGTPAEIAGAALFLASPLASYVLGQTIIVDGGKSLS